MAKKKDREIRDMTEEMQILYTDARKLEAFAEACKSRTFIRTKTIAKAIEAKDQKWAKLWSVVAVTWPETVGADLHAFPNKSIEIVYKN